jgi:hypothetical protein
VWASVAEAAIIEDVSVQVISAARREWIYPFTGLQPARFRRLVRLVAQRGGDAIADGRPGRQWALDLPDRVLLVACYWRTDLTMRQIGPLFGVSHSAAHRVIDTLGPLTTTDPTPPWPVNPRSAACHQGHEQVQLDSCSWTPRGGSGSGPLARRGTAILVMANFTS